MKTKRSKIEYFAWRGMSIAIKPLALFLSYKLIGDSFSNILALAILLSGTLMASLSMGSYRNLLLFKKGTTKYIYFNNIRKVIFAINTIIITLVTLIFSIIFEPILCVFIGLFIITEHVIHDEVRLLLYNGDRTKWAKNNCLRTLFIPCIPLLIYCTNDQISYLIIMLCLFFVNALFSYLNKGLFKLTKSSTYLLGKKKFYINYRKQFNYLVSATTNRIIQQSDKFLFSIISYELLWLYTLLCQMLNIPLVMFEMVFMSELKAKITKIKNHTFTWLNSSQIKALTLVSLMSLVAYGVTSYYIPELLEINFMIMALIICVANFTAALSMQNSEKLFWHLGDAKKYGRLEISALIIGHLIFAPLVLILGNYMLVKLPNIISILVKLRNSKKWLAN